MNKLFPSAFLFLSSIFTFAQAPQIQWQKCIGGSLVETVRDFKATPDGGYILAGHSESSDGDVSTHHGSADTWDAWVVKIDAQANIEWEHAYGGSGTDDALRINTTSDGGYIFAGTTSSSDGDVVGFQGEQDSWIVKLSNTGEIQWQKAFGANNIYNEGYDAIEAADGGYIFVTANTSSVSNVFITKLDPAGTVVWNQSYGGTARDFPRGIKATPDGGYILACNTNSADGDVVNFHGLMDVWILKIDALGVKQWAKSYGGSQIDNCIGIELTSDGGYIVCAQSASSNGDVTLHQGTTATMDFWAIKINATGTIQWQKTYGGTEHDFNSSIRELPNNNGYIVLAHTYSNNGNVTGYLGSADFWAFRISQTGTLLWQRTLGGNYNDYPTMILPTADLGYIVAGDTATLTGQVSGNHGQSDAWVVKLEPDPLLLNAVDFENETLSLSPNPTTQGVVISGKRPIKKKVIYDQMGRMLKSISTSQREIDLAFLTAGIYYVEIYDNQQKISSHKVIKM